MVTEGREETSFGRTLDKLLTVSLLPQKQLDSRWNVFLLNYLNGRRNFGHLPDLKTKKLKCVCGRWHYNNEQTGKVGMARLNCMNCIAGMLLEG